MRNLKEEVEKRRKRAQSEKFQITSLAKSPVEKLQVQGESGRVYIVAIDHTLNSRTCECHDFLSARVGTCKHIEAVLFYQSQSGQAAGLPADSIHPSASFGDSSDFQLTAAEPGASAGLKSSGGPRHLVCFDVETQNSFDDVGGRENFKKLRISIAVLYDELLNQFFVYNEDEASQLIDHLFTADVVVGYNIIGFDYLVIQPYTDRNLQRLPTLDLMRELEKKLGFRVKLDSVVSATLGGHKSGHGLQAIEWFRAGEMEKLTQYCRDDVRLTYELFKFGAANGFVYIDSRGTRQRVLVDWK